MNEPGPHFESVASETLHVEQAPCEPNEKGRTAVGNDEAKPVASPSSSPGRFSLSRSDQLFVAVIILAATVLLFAHWWRLSGWGTQPVEIQRLEPREHVFQIDINKATWVEWAQLDGIGPALAHRIVENREQNGPFASIDDVLRVKGIGAKRLEQLRPSLTIGESAP